MPVARSICVAKRKKHPPTISDYEPAAAAAPQTVSLSLLRIAAGPLTGACRRTAPEAEAFVLSLLAIKKIPNFRVSPEFHSREIPADIKAE